MFHGESSVLSGTVLSERFKRLGDFFVSYNKKTRLICSNLNFLVVG